MHKIELTVSPSGLSDRVLVDGTDLADACRGYTLRATVNEVPQLTLELDVVDQAAAVSGEAVVDVSDATRQLLVELGWTPPGQA